MTLVESVFAMFIMFAGLCTMAQVLAFCVIAGKTYGRDSGQTTAAARDKMEDLMGMQFTWDPNLTPPAAAMDAALATGTGGVAGSVYPANPLQGHADLIDSYGYTSPFQTDSEPGENVTLIRQWKIEDEENGTIKKISVSVRSAKDFGNGTPPSTTIVTRKGRDTEELKPPSS